MAAKRIAKSAVNWAALAERVPPGQGEAFRAFKARSDMFLGRMMTKPESLPAIDFAHYKGRMANPAMVDTFLKQYQGLTIPYPKDKDNVKATVDAEEKTAQAESQKFIAESQKTITEAKQLLGKIDSLPPLDELTQEMYQDYFPDQARNADRPTMWPHTKTWQPGAHPDHEIK